MTHRTLRMLGAPDRQRRLGRAAPGHRRGAEAGKPTCFSRPADFLLLRWKASLMRLCVASPHEADPIAAQPSSLMRCTYFLLAWNFW